VPQQTSRRFAAASAIFVRSEIALASWSASHLDVNRERLACWTSMHRNKKMHRPLHRNMLRSTGDVSNRNLRLEQLCDVDAATAKGSCAAATIVQQKQEHARERPWKRPKQTPTASGEIILLIRKLRWAGLEEKAQQLEKELEQSAVTDRVVPIQTETD
jgi:hypothetical protein